MDELLVSYIKSLNNFIKASSNIKYINFHNDLHQGMIKRSTLRYSDKLALYLGFNTARKDKVKVH